MKKLSENWITERLIDFEYKKYILLAYLQEVSENFDASKLYPFLAELIGHHRKLVAIRGNKKNLMKQFPAVVRGVELKKHRLVYERLIEDDAMMEEIGQILDFSIPQFEHYLAEGKQIYDFVEENLYMRPVGVVPLSPEAGYMILGGGRESKVYEYQITLFEASDETYRGVHTSYVSEYRNSYTTTFESIKTDLIRSRATLPNPATYAFETDLALPVDETYLPVAKRMLVRYIYAEK